ncbi:Polycomb protein esc [Fulvia fulva]|uniref:Polycomb protein esc n=1 Tax=Passalora fulva TaxID=5499 RepID=A0A9Q8LC50_PASFU|nr:Polycomb protein esc [Fulvia fulva]KAK4628967.1 Polycomb protein esc [Fulvia fulva]KAK4630521.1 Polycomb protein esc [Fulvia fulva]UJO14674.1 Polycomb protein esc [Fulvia fulva]WPV12786.1 Polycomb protein esc [Fulvia fulva]WPV27649.1 Polycomb protein esc [Fulvia fulva]
MPIDDVFPALLTSSRLTAVSTDKGPQIRTIYDVKFYPYNTIDDDQVFALVAEECVAVCRTKLGSEPHFEVLSWIVDEEESIASYNSLVWTKHPTTRKPLLCIAGHKPKHIKILDVETGRPVRNLVGHGKGINDLAVSPLSTSLLFSAAEDNTIRLWNLEPEYEKQPCVALFGGEGHKSPVLAMHLHPNGKWMLTGGIDTAVCLWAVPDLEELRREDGSPPDQEPMVVYHPHFFSKEVHSNYVDSFAFYDDLIISRAARDPKYQDRNEILIWRIEGFDPEATRPSQPPIPEGLRRTRTSFTSDEGLAFKRLLTLDMPHTDRFYQRFGFLHAPVMRPILAMGDQKSKFCFWDLQRLDEGLDPKYAAKLKKSRGRKTKTVSATNNLQRLGDIRRSESVAEVTPSTTPDASSTVTAEREYALADPYLLIKPHHTEESKTELSKVEGTLRHFATSQIAWSPDGTWMIAVGDLGMITIFHRDKAVVNLQDETLSGT